MKRILLIAFAWVGLASFSFGNSLCADTTSIADSSKSKSPADTTGQLIASDTLASGRDTTVLTTKQIPPATDSLSIKQKESELVPADTTAKELSGKSPGEAEKKNGMTKSSPVDPNGYKDVHWGMTAREVRDDLVDNGSVDEYSIEPITNGFEYPGIVAGVRARVGYQFDNERLYIVRLTPQVKAVSRFEYLDSFEEYQSTLESKYGKPKRTGFRKIDEQYLNTIESIQLGFAKKYALWEFERSYIVLVLLGHNKRLEIHITYVSRAIFDEMKDRIESLKLEDF